MAVTDVRLLDDGTPPLIDTIKASIVLVYDAFLGGKNSYEINREVVRRIQLVTSERGQTARDNRTFLIRVTRFLAGQAGITQFLDCGARLPTAENTHQVAQRTQSGAHMVYVDNAPVVLAHGRALLEVNDQTHFSAADIFTPHQVLNDEVVRRYFDFANPIALFHLGMLYHHDGEPSPQSIMGEYIDALPSGSYVAIGHFPDPETTPELSGLAQKLEEVFLLSQLGTEEFRTRAEIEGMLPGVELVEAGLTQCAA